MEAYAYLTEAIPRKKPVEEWERQIVAMEAESRKACDEQTELEHLIDPVSQSLYIQGWKAAIRWAARFLKKDRS